MPGSSSFNYSYSNFFNYISVPLIACNAFAMCSDVMPSLIFLGVTGYVSWLLLASVFSMWLILYLCGGGNDSTRNSFEREYYLSKLKRQVTAQDKDAIKSWVEFNYFRIKLYNSLSIHSSGEIDKIHKIDTHVSFFKNRYLKNKFRLDGDNDIKKMISKWIEKFSSDLKKSDVNLGLAEGFILSTDSFNINKGYFDNSCRDDLLDIFKGREKDLISNQYILKLVSFFAAANIAINALTMFGSAAGVMKTISTMLSLSISPFALNIMAIVFLLAGACASFKLTRPMIHMFGRKLDKYCNLDDIKANFSPYTFLSIIMAFFTAAASAVFAVYNTPIIAMLPPSLLGLSFAIRCLTFAIVIVSSFSLYFVSVSTKLESWRQYHSDVPIAFDKLFAALGFIALSILTDITLMPASYYGCIEVITLLGLACNNYFGESGLPVVIALLASFSFCLTSFHQFCVLFTPGIICKALIVVETLFQFSTFSITFYFGSSKFLEGIKKDPLTSKSLEGIKKDPLTSKSLDMKNKIKGDLMVSGNNIGNGHDLDAKAGLAFVN